MRNLLLLIPLLLPMATGAAESYVSHGVADGLPARVSILGPALHVVACDLDGGSDVTDEPLVRVRTTLGGITFETAASTYTVMNAAATGVLDGRSYAGTRLVEPGACWSSASS